MEEELNEYESFTIRDDNTADWALNEILEKQKETDRLIKIAEQKIFELNERIKAEQEKLDKSTSYLKSKLREYFETVEHKKTKTQESYKLLTGNLVMKNATQKMVKDDEELLSYMKEHKLNDFIKTKESVDWASYKKECEIVDGKVVNVQTGQLIECIKVEDVPESFDIKF